MIGKEILNYTITTFIGQGGMGSVYVAEHKLIKNQKAAIKVINADMVNDFTRAKLQEEAEHLARLNHSNIVHFANYHIDEEGNVYLIMEYADGVSLDKYINTISGLIVEDRICPLFEPILDAVGYAHKQGILHRDIKPSNIVITTDGQPKILDFGIAKIMKESDSEEPDKMIMGTPSYMSPEQVKGEHLDGRSDIYSLGVLLHQMLTGNTPYDTTTMSEFEIQQKVVEDPLPRMRTYYKYTSDKVQKVVDKATAKRPADRYQTCEEFKKALHNAIYPPKIPMWGKVTAAAVALLVIGIGLWIWDYNRVKVCYYADYAEQWGVPQGLGELSGNEHAHRLRSYRMEYQHYKLQRMSLVNNRDYVINHNTTDDIERPADAQYFYTADGKVDYVKVYNAAGKCLYVKDYNGELTVAVFKYDDQFGTEKNLSANTITTFTNTMSDDVERGRISRYLITYDANGYVQEIRYAGFQNIRVCDADGLYGRRYQVDSYGRVTEETFLGYNGEPKATKSGMAIRTREYGKGFDPIRFCYLSPTREAAGEQDLGIAVCRNELDEWGNSIGQFYETLDGQPAVRQDQKVAGQRMVIENGLTMSVSFVDEDGNPCFSKEGMAVAKFEYDNRGFVCAQRYYDIDGTTPVMASEGNYGLKLTNDDRGNVLSFQNVDAENAPMMLPTGYCGMVFQYDDRGNITRREFRDTEDHPVNTNNNYAIELNTYDAQNHCTETRFLDAEGEPAITPSLISYIRNTYTAQGNLETVSYYNGTGDSLMLIDDGLAVCKYIYDEHGNEVERLFFDDEEKPCKALPCRFVFTYDDNGNKTSVRYYDADGKLTVHHSDKFAGCNYKRDAHGNILEEYPIGTDGKLMHGKLIARYKFDDMDNEVEFSLFDANEKPATNTYGYHRYECTYNSRKQRTEIRYYGTNGKLTTYNSDTYAIQRDTYDGKGNRVHCEYFGTDEKPVVCKEGWASSDYEHDAMGNITRQLFYGIDGKPTEPKQMVPEGICRYDGRGNMTYLASMDGHGNLIMNPNTGWAASHMEYDARNNRISQTYFDTEDKPIVPQKVGYHKIVNEYNIRDKKTSEAYFNAEGAPMLHNGMHQEVYTYDEMGRLIEDAMFDTNGKPTNGNYTFHRVVYSYNDNSQTAKYAKLFDKNGRLVNSLRRNAAGEWEQNSSGGTSPASSSSSSSNSGKLADYVNEIAPQLPMDIGEGDESVTLYSMRMTGSNSCEMLIKAKSSMYEMNDSEIAKYKALAPELASSMKQNLPAGSRITIIVQDSKGRELARSTK